MRKNQKSKIKNQNVARLAYFGERAFRSLASMVSDFAERERRSREARTRSARRWASDFVLGAPEYANRALHTSLLSKIVLVGITALFLWALVLSPASAQIVPACGPDGTGPCTLCDLWKLGHNIINFLLWGLAIPVLTVLLLWGGVVWATSSGSPGQVTRGKQIMTTGLVGILIALSAWLVVDTIITTLAAEGEFKTAWNKFPDCAEPIKIKPADLPPATTTITENWVAYRCLNKLDCVVGDPDKSVKLPLGPFSTEQECRDEVGAIEGQDKDISGTRTNWVCAVEAPTGTLTHEQAKQRLDAAGIGISSTGNCSDKSKSTCTSLDGIREAVINEVVLFKNQCGCSVTVTGGTETGHAAGTYSHGAGYKIDIDAADDKTDAASRFIIRSNTIFDSALPRGTGCHDEGPRYVRKGNPKIDYSFESCPSHWDITVRP